MSQPNFATEESVINSFNTLAQQISQLSSRLTEVEGAQEAQVEINADVEDRLQTLESDPGSGFSIEQY